MKPHRIIGDNYLHRWHVIPRNRFFNIYLHRFLHSDDDRALHDHPWHSVSFLLKGKLEELSPMEEIHCPDYPEARLLNFNSKNISWLKPVFRTAKFAHRLVLVEGPAWTIFITGPVIREWGFHCPRGWVHWRDFTDASGNNIGRGCE